MSTVTVHCYGDSGPYGVWAEGAPHRSVAEKSYDVPAHLWAEFQEAQDSQRNAEDHLEDYCTLVDMTEHGATTGHDGFFHPGNGDSLVRCVTCHSGWYLNEIAPR